MKRSINTSIVLNDAEANIRDLLVKFCNYHNSSADCDPNKHLELRITGGWVRDKLLGNESHDIDIAINFLSGEEFATALHEYLNQYHPELRLKAFHKIKKNPAKSKHLETCTTKLFGLDIDFVNLRSEQYTTDSRVPIIECGTAEEDALRRDATLNALFYNLNQNKIEDFTGKGLNDLQSGILRTPLQPLQTFLDDPLRVLRLIRFASRFDFLVESETLDAMKNPELKTTLIHKISRERVGVELEKILTSPNPQYGLDLINHVGLAESIFNTGTLSDTISKVNGAETNQELSHRFSALSTRIRAVTSLKPLFDRVLREGSYNKISSIYDKLTQNDQLRKLFWLTEVLEPFGALSVQLNSKKAIDVSVVEVILKEGLRFGKHDFNTSANIIKHSSTSYHVLESFFEKSDVKRSDLGVYLREFGQYSDLNLIFNCFNDILKAIDFPSNPEQIPMPVPVPFNLSETQHSVLSEIVQKYDDLLVFIEAQGLVDVDSLKPIIDGKLLCQSLKKKPGPWMSEVMQKVLVWQLENPNGSQAECLDYITPLVPT